MRVKLFLVVPLLLCSFAWADDSGISSGSGINPGEPWVDDGLTLFPGSDRDIDFSDDTPHLTFRDSDTNTAWQIHVNDSAADWRGMAFWYGTQTASGAQFNVGTSEPSFRINQAGALFMDLLQTAGAARCLELAATGQVTLASAACGSGGSGDSVTVNTTAIDTTANLKDTTTVTWAVVDGGAGGPDDAQATAVDVTCTDCLGTTEIADSYVLNAGDAMTGDLDMNDGAGDSPVITWTPATGTVWGIYTIDSDDDLQIQSNTASTETVDFVNIGAGVTNVTVDGTFGASSGITIDATTESNIEAAADIGGEVTSTGMGSTVVADSLAVTDWNLTTPTFTTQFTLTAQANPTTDADGECALDTDGWGSGFDAYECFNGTASAYLVATTASDIPANGDVPTFNTGGSITWEAPGAASGDVTDVGNCSGLACFTGASGDTLTFNDADGDQTLAYDTTANDFSLSDDLNITDATPHLDLIDSGADDWELDGSNGQFILWNKTDSAQIFRVEADNSLTITQNLNVSGIAVTGLPPKEIWFPCSALLPVEAADSIPPLNYDAGTNIDQVSCALDASVDEGRTGFFKVPADIAASGIITIRMLWYSAAATSGAAVMDFRHNLGTASGVDPDVTLAVVPSTTTTAGTAGMVNFTTIELSIAASGWVANDLVYFLAERDANHVADTLAGDLLLLGVSIEIPLQ